MSRIDIAGRRFGRLTVLQFSHTVRKKAFWICLCDCGAQVTRKGEQLRNGETASCGCLNHELTCQRNKLTKTHGYTGTRIYECWKAMRKRCLNPKHRAFARYGGRGITICERWNDFQNFLTDMGEMPVGLSLDRINNDGNYEPANCRWATPSEQQRNKRSSPPSKHREAGLGTTENR